MIIETERLLLRPFKKTDSAPYAEMNADAETMRYFDRTNTPSRRVMEKIGMTYDPPGDFMHPVIDPANELAHHVTYRINNPDLF